SRWATPSSATATCGSPPRFRTTTGGSSPRSWRSLAVAKIGPFEAHHERYEEWFEAHRAAYVSELLALRQFVPWEGHGLEIGVGTGRFAGPLGVPVGLDPSDAMLSRAAARGIE